jgi:uncharacterized protein (DUF2267 family)
MSSAGADAFNHALHTANIWLADIASALGTRDRRFSQRVIRTWLHTLRDRLTVDAATKFGQQLPELLRGGYYDGWEPNRVPIKYTVDQYLQRFAAQAGIPPAEVPATAATVTGVIASHMSPGQLDEALAELPRALRVTVAEGTPAAVEGGTTAHAATAAGPATRLGHAAADRIATLEGQVGSLTEAVRTLARGLTDGQLTGRGIDQDRVSRAAHLAEEILIATGTPARAAAGSPRP